ncbi:hypothetical protein [Caballeronia sp. KNU42]
MADAASGRNNLNSGSDSAKHYAGTASQQYDRTPATSPSTPAVPGGQVVRDLTPTNVPGSAVKS